MAGLALPQIGAARTRADLKILRAPVLFVSLVFSLEKGAKERILARDSDPRAAIPYSVKERRFYNGEG